MKNLQPKKFYRIQIYSANHLTNPIPPSGLVPDWNDSYYQIDVPDILDSDKYQIAVESFNLNRTGANANNGYVVHCTSLTQANTYSTLTQSTSHALLTYNGNTFYRFIDFSSIGTPLRDLTFMRNKQIRIYLSTLDGVPIVDPNYFGANIDWVMSLIIFPIEANEY
jgi:hypothetical protein